MLFSFTTFLLFLYLKIVRVYRKEEKQTLFIFLQNILVSLSAVVTLLYGFTHYGWYFVFGMGFMFFIVAALIVTAVQLGIFIDGKPQFGISKFYKLLPLLTLVIMALSAILWF